MGSENSPAKGFLIQWELVADAQWKQKRDGRIPEVIQLHIKHINKTNRHNSEDRNRESKWNIFETDQSLDSICHVPHKKPFTSQNKDQIKLNEVTVACYKPNMLTWHVLTWHFLESRLWLTTANKPEPNANCTCFLPWCTRVRDGLRVSTYRNTEHWYCFVREHGKRSQLI